MFTHHQAMLYNRKALGKMRYNTEYKIAADYELTARFLKDHNDVLYCAIPFCIFESGGISQQNAKLGRTAQHQIRKNLELVNPLANAIITTAQKILWTLRTIAPSLYWHLKSSDNNEHENKQSDTPPDRPENQA